MAQLGNKAGHALAAGALVAVGVAAGATAAAVTIRSRDVHLIRTAAGPALVKTLTAGGERVRVLQQDGVYQSATYLDERRFEPVFNYYRAFDVMFQAESDLRAHTGAGIERVLMLGGGGFSYPKHLLTSRSGLALDVVEVDAAVVRLARRWFFLTELEARLADPARAQGNALGIYVADGLAYLRAAAARGARYQAIVNDAFVGAEPVAHLATLEAARAVRACLSDRGLYLVNVVSKQGGGDLSFLRDQVATLLAAFAHVHVIEAVDAHFGGECNYLLVATDGSAAFDGAVPYDEGFPGTVLGGSAPA